jgi:nucleoside-triphosphate--adenylate kinase
MASKAGAKIFRCIITGAPGSGKGTISARIVKDFGFKHLSSGDVMRKNIVEKTALGQKLKPYLDKGALVPDNLTCSLIIAAVSDLEKGRFSWLLDGFPRSVPQAQELDKQLTEKRKADILLNLDVPFEIIVDRMSKRFTHLASGRVYSLDFNAPKVPGKDDVTGEPLVQRNDDKPETVLARLNYYKTYTAPVLDHYRKTGRVVDFKGKYSNEIWPQVWKYLATRVKPLQYTDYGTAK